MDDDEKKHDDASPYSLTVLVIQNKLTMSLQDKRTKNMYQGAFASDELLQCGFSKKQASNLGGISKFIETAKAGRNNLKFSISIEENDKSDAVNDNDEDAEGVHGVIVSETAAKAIKTESEEVGVIKISKEDDFFGEIQFVMKLKKMPRKQGDINQDHINDLKQRLNVLQQDYAKNDIALKKQLKINETERDELKKGNKALQQQLDTLQNETKKLKAMITESKEEYSNDLKRTDQSIHSEITEMSKHEMPKGSIIMWSGTQNNIPKGWRICDGNGGTPDLTNRFIIGAGGQYNAKTTGGNKQHSHNITVDGHQLTVNEMPTHSHNLEYGVYCRNNDYSYGVNRGQNKFMDSKCYVDDNILERTGGNQAHNHTANSSSTQHLPPYYALCFVIKMI